MCKAWSGAVAERLRLQRSWEHYRMLRGAEGSAGAAGAGAAEAGGAASPRRAPPAAAPAPRAALQDRDHFAFTTVRLFISQSF